jgi:hypothetical protein
LRAVIYENSNPRGRPLTAVKIFDAGLSPELATMPQNI